MIKRLQMLGILLIVISMSIFAGFKISYYIDAKKQAELFEYFEATLDKARDKGYNVSQINVLGDYDYVPLPYAMIATLEIPSVDIKVAVIEGVEADDIDVSVGHFPQTNMPWVKGSNFSVAGHSSISHYMLFNDLHEVEIGDEIIVQTTYGVFKYQITSKETIDADDVYVLEENKDGTNTITLITCINSGKQRLCVKGVMINNSNTFQE